MGSAAEQGRIWGARASDWRNCNEPAWHEVFAKVLDAAGVAAETRYLDIGCGAGGALEMASRRGAQASGIDASEALVGEARARLPGCHVAIGEMEELPFAAGSFDVVSGINSFQFAADMGRALREAGRVCRSGGTLAILVWGRQQRSDLLSAIMPHVFALLPPSPPGATAPPPLSEPGRLAKLIAEAGLRVVSVEEFASDLLFPDAATATRACMSASARAIAHAGEAAVERALATAMEKFVRSDGRVRLGNEFLLGLATRH